MEQRDAATASSVVILCGAVCFMPAPGPPGETGADEPVDAVRFRQGRWREAGAVGGWHVVLRGVVHVLTALTLCGATGGPWKTIGSTAMANAFNRRRP